MEVFRFLLVLMIMTTLGRADSVALKNLASLTNGGTCESSSEWSEQFACEDALDGEISPAAGASWATARGNAVGSWININLSGKAILSKLRLKNRCRLDSQMKTVRAFFENGLYQTVHLNCYDGGSTAQSCPDQVWDEVSIGSVISSTVKIVGLAACDPSNADINGFQEVEIYGTPVADSEYEVLASKDATCKSSSEWSEAYACTEATDGVFSPNSGASWATASGDVIDSWIKISFSKKYEITKLRLKNRVGLDSQMRTVRVRFERGKSQKFELTCYEGPASKSYAEQVWDYLDVPGIITSRVKIVGVEPCDPENAKTNGFQEVEIYGKPVE